MVAAMTKDERNAVARQRRRENPEYYRAIERRYRARFPERQTGKKTRWRRQNVERARMIEKARRDHNVEYYREKTRAERARRPPDVADRIRRKCNYRQKYGISIDDFSEMSRRQNGRCAACGGLPGKRFLNVDHDHDTGVVRGLLCHACNVSLGFLRDDLRLIEALAVYIKRHTAGGVSSEVV